LFSVAIEGRLLPISKYMGTRTFRFGGQKDEAEPEDLDWDAFLVTWLKQGSAESEGVIKRRLIKLGYGAGLQVVDPWPAKSTNC